MGVLGTLVGLAFPIRCASCRSAADEPLCTGCLSSVPWIRGPVCERCGRPGPPEAASCAACRLRPPAFDRARAAAAYAGPARDLLLAFKFGGERRAAGAMGRWMVEAAGSAPPIDVVCPVPSARSTLAARGFNPAGLLARAVGKEARLPSVALLRKPRPTPDQAGLTGSERRRNLAGAFESRAAPPGVLLVDDVITTGTTADACARALRAAGARRVWVLAFARADERGGPVEGSRPGGGGATI